MTQTQIHHNVGYYKEVELTHALKLTECSDKVVITDSCHHCTFGSPYLVFYLHGAESLTIDAVNMLRRKHRIETQASYGD